MSEYGAIKIGEDELFQALWQMATDQNADSWSEETEKRIDDLNEHFDCLERCDQVNLSNGCSDLALSACDDGFRQGFKAAVALLRTLGEM